MSNKSNIDTLSATELVLDLLEGHASHRLPVQKLVRAASLFDIRPQAVRVALTRLARQGRVESPARGVYALQTRGSTLLQDVEAWLRREERAVTWNGYWVGVSDAGAPRTQRTRWRRHLRALALRGFRELAPGLHLRPDNLRGGVPALRGELDSLGLAPEALTYGVTELDEVHRERARHLWDTDGLERRYLELLSALAQSRRALERGPLERAARDSLLLGHEAIRAILYDPLLPDQMMAGRARADLIARMREYQQWARGVWSAFLAEGEGDDGA
ncbi:PaaX family transcriptional regulator C-terminal domain-containing protein [Parahaliea mediterranea]|uniref:PaaX family transcriptional regulator n=1 Tax=Parahaliea mediterranea TaxID=651086 RepID=A0A939IK23_9GAMM|nr:PaaX family transcriptional regulator C-terminal domain-containing protein [Parahaliea mediterranea]MBN7796891.1 hypothetical protein [Parahaliea mediterranea]